MMDGSNDQGWGFLILCAVGLFTAHFLKPSATSQGGLPTPAETGQGESVVENAASSDLTVEAADAGADVANTGNVTAVGGADAAFAAPTPPTSKSYGGPASATRSRSGAVFGEVNGKVDGKNVTDL